MTTSELGGRKATDSHGIVRAWSYQQIEGRTRKQGGDISETASFTAILCSECAPLSL